MIKTLIKVAPPGTPVKGHGQAVVPVRGARVKVPVIEDGMLYRVVH